MDVKVVKILVDTGFLQAQDLGRLAAVSKSLQAAATNEVVWESLCLKEFPFVKQHYKKSTEKLFRTFYKRCSMPLSKRARMEAPFCLNEPRFKEEDIKFHVSVKFKGKSLLRRSIATKKGLNNMLYSGGLSITLKNPIVLGKAEWDLDEAEDYMDEFVLQEKGFPVKCSELEAWHLPFDINIVMVAKSSPKQDVVCPLFTSDDCIVDRDAPLLQVHPLKHGYYDELSPNTKFNLKKPQTSNVVYAKQHEYKHWPMRKTPQGNEILKRLKTPIFFGVILHFCVTEDSQFALKGLSIQVLKKMDKACVPYYGENEAEEHGVSLMHIFSEIDEDFRFNEVSSS